MDQLSLPTQIYHVVGNVEVVITPPPAVQGGSMINLVCELGIVRMRRGDQKSRPLSAASSASDTLTSTTHGITHLSGPYKLGGSTLPGGLDTSTRYWVDVVDANTIKLRAPFSKTFATTDVTVAADTITVTAHRMATGAVVQFTTTGTLPAGLAAGRSYWLIVVDANTLKIANNVADSAAGVGIDITDQGTGTHTIKAWATTDPATFPVVDLTSNGTPSSWTIGGITVAVPSSSVSDGTGGDRMITNERRLMPMLDKLTVKGDSTSACITYWFT